MESSSFQQGFIQHQFQFTVLKKKKLITSIDENNDNVLSLAFSPNNNVFASCGSDTTIRLWDFEAWIEEFKQDSQTKSKPRCFKMIGTTSQLQSNQCLIKGAIIESNQGFNLTRLFMQKGAVDQ